MTEALVVIDLQRWFFRTEARAEKLPLLVSRVNALAAESALANRPVILVRTGFSLDASTWSPKMRAEKRPVLLEGTQDVEPVDGLDLGCVAMTITKTRHSAFVRTEFEAMLRKAGITSVLLSGAFLDGCVGLTAIDAAERDFGVRMAGDAIISVDDAQGASILRFLEEEFDIPTV